MAQHDFEAYGGWEDEPYITLTRSDIKWLVALAAVIGTGFGLLAAWGNLL